MTGESFRAIARDLGRAPSKLSREVNANGGRDSHRAVDGEASVQERALRPKTTKLEHNDELRDVVKAKLPTAYSAKQVVTVAGRGSILV